MGVKLWFLILASVFGSYPAHVIENIAEHVD
jgi:hypothetical protein